MKIKFNLDTKIGMRNLKTALAVTISLYLSSLLKLDTPIFTSIACITGMKSSFAESFKDFQVRMFTSIFGVILGFLLAMIPVPEYVSPIIAGLGIIFIIYILVALDLKDMVILSCIVYIASFVYPEGKIIYGLNRIFGTFIGLVVALIVNFFLSSPDVQGNFNSVAIETYIEARKLLFNFIFTSSHSTNEFEILYKKTEEQYKLLLDELHAPIHANFNINNSRKVIKLFSDLHLRFLLLESINEIPKLKPSIIGLLEDEFHTTKYVNGTLEGDLNEMYNLHMKKILFNLESLRELLNINEI